MRQIPGTPFTPSARDMNAATRASELLNRSQRTGGNAGYPRTMHGDYILIQNDSGAARAPLEVVGIGDIVISPTDNLAEFKEHPVFSGVLPTSQHIGKWAVLLDGAPPGGLVKAMVGGVQALPVAMLSEAHRYADVQAGEVMAASCISGSAQLLYIQPVAEREVAGVAWCVALLGAPAPAQTGRPAVIVGQGYVRNDIHILKPDVTPTNGQYTITLRDVETGDDVTTATLAYGTSQENIQTAVRAVQDPEAIVEGTLESVDGIKITFMGAAYEGVTLPDTTIDTSELEGTTRVTLTKDYVETTKPNPRDCTYWVQFADALDGLQSDPLELDGDDNEIVLATNLFEIPYNTHNLRVGDCVVVKTTTDLGGEQRYFFSEWTPLIALFFGGLFNAYGSKLVNSLARYYVDHFTDDGPVMTANLNRNDVHNLKPSVTPTAGPYTITLRNISTGYDVTTDILDRAASQADIQAAVRAVQDPNATVRGTLESVDGITITFWGTEYEGVILPATTVDTSGLSPGGITVTTTRQSIDCGVGYIAGSVRWHNRYYAVGAFTINDVGYALARWNRSTQSWDGIRVDGFGEAGVFVKLWGERMFVGIIGGSGAGAATSGLYEITISDDVESVTDTGYHDYIGTDAVPRCMLAWDDGNIGEQLYVGGDTGIGATTGGICKWDGNTTWSAVGNGLQDAGQVWGLCVHDGKLVMVGSFATNYDALTLNNVASWDGTVYAAFGAGVAKLGNDIICSCCSFGGDLYVGQYVSDATVDGAPSLRIWSGGAWKLPAELLKQCEGYYRMVFDGSNDRVGRNAFRALTEYSGRMLLGGDQGWRGFKRGFNGCGPVVFWDATAQAMVKVKPPPIGKVYGICECGDYVALGGDYYRSVRGVGRCRNIALYQHTAGTVDDGIWDALGAGANGPIYAVAWFNGELIAGGCFTEIGGQKINNLARWNGTTWLPIGNVAQGGTVRCLLVTAAGHLLVGGDFASVDGQAQYGYLFDWDGNETLTAMYATPPTADSGTVSVNALCEASGYFYAGGNFTTWDGWTVNNITRRQSSGGQWYEMHDSNGEHGLPGVVYTIACRVTDGNIYVGTQLLATIRQPTHPSACWVWHAATPQWANLDVFLDWGSALRSVIACPDGNVLIGGDEYRRWAAPVEAGGLKHNLSKYTSATGCPVGEFNDTIFGMCYATAGTGAVRPWIVGEFSGVGAPGTSIAGVQLMSQGECAISSIGDDYVARSVAGGLGAAVFFARFVPTPPQVHGIEVVPPQNDVHRYVPDVAGSGGAYTFTLEDKDGVQQPIDAIGYGASNDEITAAINAVLGAGAVYVHGTMATRIEIEYCGPGYAGKPWPLGTCNIDELEGPTEIVIDKLDHAEACESLLVSGIFGSRNNQRYAHQLLGLTVDGRIVNVQGGVTGESLGTQTGANGTISAVCIRPVERPDTTAEGYVNDENHWLPCESLIVGGFAQAYNDYRATADMGEVEEWVYSPNAVVFDGHYFVRRFAVGPKNIVTAAAWAVDENGDGHWVVAGGGEPPHWYVGDADAGDWYYLREPGNAGSLDFGYSAGSDVRCMLTFDGLTYVGGILYINPSYTSHALVTIDTSVAEPSRTYIAVSVPGFDSSGGVVVKQIIAVDLGDGEQLLLCGQPSTAASYNPVCVRSLAGVWSAVGGAGLSGAAESISAMRTADGWQVVAVGLFYIDGVICHAALYRSDTGQWEAIASVSALDALWVSAADVLRGRYILGGKMGAIRADEASPYIPALSLGVWEDGYGLTDVPGWGGVNGSVSAVGDASKLLLPTL